jgi:NAD(P)-dependent dehydrogenase (short-subunit alcohol dehydrogenase family)
MQRPNGLENKRVVVMAGSSGIGLAVAELSATHGAEVVIASSQEARIQQAISAIGGKTQGEVVDVSDERSVETFFTRLGAFDHLVFTADHSLQLVTTGIASPRPQKGWVIASSVCGTIEALTRALAIELAPIRVNAVSPGVVRTTLWRSMSAAEREKFFESVGNSLPVGRVGEARDIAQAYVFLMQEGFATVQVFLIDGSAVIV